MDKKWKTVMFRTSLVSTVIIVIYWAIYYLKNGNVPCKETVGFLFGLETYYLQFCIPRWLDLFIGPIMTPVLVYTAWLMSKMDDDALVFRVKDFVSIGVFLLTAVSYLFGLFGGIATGFVNFITLPTGMALIILFFYIIYKIICFLLVWTFALDQ